VFVAVTNFIWPADRRRAFRSHRKKARIAGNRSLSLVTAYPTLLWLVDGPSFSKMLLVE